MSIALQSEILASDDGGMLFVAVVALLFGGLFLLFPFIMTGALIWSDRRSGRKVKRNPACSHCGYNLTGNTSGVCPECGAACTVVPPSPNVQSQEPPRGWFERLPDSVYSILIVSLLLAVCAAAAVVVIGLIWLQQ